jgi:hypothetical protein
MRADSRAGEGKIQEYTEGESNQYIDSVTLAILYAIG